jgi:cell division protein FtsW (lipid II flippase)
MIIKRKSTSLILWFMILFGISGLMLLAFIKGEFDPGALKLCIGIVALILIQYNVLKGVFKHLERFTLLIADFLCVLSLIVLYRLDPDIAARQFVWIVIGNAAMVAALLVIRKIYNFGRANWLFMAIMVALLGSTLLFARAIGGAKNWIDIGSFSFQPSELAKILFIVVTAYFLSTRKKMRSLWIYVIFTAASVGLLVLSKDLGTALLFCGTFLVVFYAGTGNAWLTLGGIGVFGAGAVGSYYLFSHVKVRVDVWRDPWSLYNDQGYQIVQGLMAIASGGLLGSGLGLGMPGVIPAAHTDYIFAVVSEEFGLIAGIMLIVFYLVFIIRGILIALRARSAFDALLVFGCTVMLSLQSFIIIGGVIKLIPLTGITLPFLSYGGSSVLSAFLQLGIIEGVAIKNGESDEAEIAEMGGEFV